MARHRITALLAVACAVAGRRGADHRHRRAGRVGPALAPARRPARRRGRRRPADQDLRPAGDLPIALPGTRAGSRATGRPAGRVPGVAEAVGDLSFPAAARRRARTGRTGGDPASPGTAGPRPKLLDGSARSTARRRPVPARSPWTSATAAAAGVTAGDRAPGRREAAAAGPLADYRVAGRGRRAAGPVCGSPTGRRSGCRPRTAARSPPDRRPDRAPHRAGRRRNGRRRGPRRSCGAPG